MFAGLAGLASLGGGIAGLIGGSPAQNVNIPPTWPGAGGQFSAAATEIPGLSNYNLYTGALPQANQFGQNIANNPFGGGYLGGSGMAGDLATGGALGGYGNAGNLYNAGTTALNLGFDPQSSLYNYLQNQNTQQSNVENAMAGVATTPYGAGVTDYANQQFNLNWQNQRLQRALQGLSGAGGAYNQAFNMQAQAPVNYLYGAGLPFNTYNTINTSGLQGLGAAGQFGQAGSAIPEQQIQNQIGLGGTGGGYGIGAGNLALNQANLGFQQNQAYGGMIGGGLGALKNLPTGWGGGNTGWNIPLPGSSPLGQGGIGSA